MFAAAFGAAAPRVSCADEVSGSTKVPELVRLAWLAGVPSVVPFGP
jgi:hypothetical protein